MMWFKIVFFSLNLIFLIYISCDVKGGRGTGSESRVWIVIKGALAQCGAHSQLNLALQISS
jgi:hypothetical protein